jgi:hypothetical protein
MAAWREEGPNDPTATSSGAGAEAVLRQFGPAAQTQLARV